MFVRLFEPRLGTDEKTHVEPMLKLRYRLLIATAGAGVCAVLPSPSPTEGKPQIALIAVTQWLENQSADAPLRALLHDGLLPQLAVDLVTSPPMPEPMREAAAAQIAAVGTEWARRCVARGEPIRCADSMPMAPLSVMIGELGVQASLTTNDGELRFLHMFWQRRRLRPMFASALLLFVLAFRPLLQVLILASATVLLILLRNAI
jgi:hypothetical protein